ncbi:MULTISPECIES: hypothetical protein [unclassified Synechococcus]|uniref:hypothetical protein n=1 Tax=unclassified Synechococcus TaxID=2626047 RepID=UPI001C22172C|nr:MULTISPECIES: hypothetical protein [unclassified Synechococcus]
MAPPRPPLSLAGPLLTLPLLLSACGGTPFGDALSRSFSRAPAAPAAPAPVSRTTAPATPAPAPAAPKPAAGKEPAVPGATTPAGQAAGALPVAPAAPAVRPAPYRVTIRLPQADPSAPAEVVTKALRAAGVPFEVETIERMPSAGSGAVETPAAPAGAANGSAPATSRPAPAPR